MDERRRQPRPTQRPVHLQRRRHIRGHPNRYQPLRLHGHGLGWPLACEVKRAQALEVRNRWGELIWSTDDPERPWLGESAGGMYYAPNGLYLWKVTYRDQLGYPVVRQGTVSLVR